MSSSLMKSDQKVILFKDKSCQGSGSAYYYTAAAEKEEKEAVVATDSEYIALGTWQLENAKTLHYSSLLFTASAFNSAASTNTEDSFQLYSESINNGKNKNGKKLILTYHLSSAEKKSYNIEDLHKWLECRVLFDDALLDDDDQLYLCYTTTTSSKKNKNEAWRVEKFTNLTQQAVDETKPWALPKFTIYSNTNTDIDDVAVLTEEEQNKKSAAFMNSLKTDVRSTTDDSGVATSVFIIIVVGLFLLSFYLYFLYNRVNLRILNLEKGK